MTSKIREEEARMMALDIIGFPWNMDKNTNDAIDEVTEILYGTKRTKDSIYTTLFANFYGAVHIHPPHELVEINQNIENICSK